MKTIQLNTEEYSLLIKLLENYITEQENVKNETEETLETKGQNAIIAINTSRANGIIKKIKN